MIARLISLMAFCLLMLAMGAMAQTVGRLSYIEPDAAPGIVARGDLRRLPTGFVEVIHDARLEACKRQRYERCVSYEWSVPFTTLGQAQKLERALSEAWNRYDARVYWRVQMQINGIGGQLANCAIGVFNWDAYLGAWDKDLFRTMPTGDFCDDLGGDWFLYLSSFCSLMDSFTFWDRVANAYQDAYTHALTHYYPEYWKDVLEAFVRYAPLALWWDGVYPVLPGGSSGLVLQPVVDVPNPQQYVNLALEAQRRDLRGFAYILARYPFLNLLGGSALDTLQQSVRRLPLEAEHDGEPGLPTLEGLKRTLSPREGIFSRPAQWADVIGTGPQPRGSSGAATPYEYAGVGHAVFIAAQSTFITEVSPRVPVFWRTCWTETIPPVPVPVPLPMPVLHANSRVDTRWMSVPEGYAIPDVRDVPRF
jgi:hypothetical protein